MGARVEVDALPRSEGLASQPLALQRICTLSGGDDYELVFTAGAADAARVRRAAAEAGVNVTRFGRIEVEPGLQLVDAAGSTVNDEFGSFDHFVDRPVDDGEQTGRTDD